MKITRSEDAALGRILYDLEPQEYDGVPAVTRLWIDGRLLWGFADHACIAEALLVHRYVSGPLTLSAACAPATANALRAFFAPRFVSITHLTLAPRQPSFGAQTIVLGSAARSRPGFAVDLAPDLSFRSVLTLDRASFTSNLRTLLRPGESEVALALALTILFAGNLHVRNIVVDRQDLPNYGTGSLDALAWALRLVNLNLEILHGAG